MSYFLLLPAQSYLHPDRESKTMVFRNASVRCHRRRKVEAIRYAAKVNQTVDRLEQTYQDEQATVSHCQDFSR